METDYWNQVTLTPKTEKAKVPVEVTINVKPDGKMLPMYIKWKNGCLYEIDKIIDIKPKGSNRIVYRIIINNKKTTLYYNNKVWLVDEK